MGDTTSKKNVNFQMNEVISLTNSIHDLLSHVFAGTEYFTLVKIASFVTLISHYITSHQRYTTGLASSDW